LQLSRNISVPFISHVLKKFKMLWENGFEYSLKSSAVKGSKKLYTTGSVVLNWRETIWKNEE
jgi:hypothetical protein